MVLYAFAESIAAVLALRFLQGAALGYAWTIVQVIVGASAPPRIRGTVYAFYFGIGAVAFPIANAVYALLAYQPIAIPLALSAALFIAVAVIVAFLERVEPPRPGGERGGGGVLPVMLALALFLFSLRLGSAFTMSDVVYVYLKEFYGLSKSFTALILALASAIGIAVSIALNALADRVSERLAAALIGVAASLGLILFSTVNVALTCIGIVLLVASARSLTPLSRRIAITRAQSEGVGYISAVGNVGVLASSLALGAACDVLKAPLGPIFNSLASFTIPLAVTIMLLSLVLAYKLG